MPTFDWLFFFVPFTIGIIVFFRAGHKFYSTTAVLLTGLAMIVFFSDIKPFWMTFIAYIALWMVIFLIPKRVKR